MVKGCKQMFSMLKWLKIPVISSDLPRRSSGFCLYHCLFLVLAAETIQKADSFRGEKMKTMAVIHFYVENCKL